MNRTAPQKEEDAIPRILVVDDMPDNLFLMKGLLEDIYDVVQATSGREALRIVQEGPPPDLVLLDIMMPDMDGYEVLRRLRQHPPTANIPVIFLTALSSPQDKRLGLDLGAIDYLTKPVDPGKVIDRVEAHVRLTRQARRMEELSERMSRNLDSQAWHELVHGAERWSVSFEEGVYTVLYAETLGREARRESLVAEVDWLAARYGGQVDRFADGAAVTFFEDAGTCVRMAMDLQRSARGLHLRMGVHTGRGAVATFHVGGRPHFTLLGPEAALAAHAADSAASGSIVISPETYVLVQHELQADSSGCLLMEEFNDSDLAQACIAPAPVEMSTFAGLGLT